MANKDAKSGYDWFVDNYKKLGYRSLNHFADTNGYQKSSLSRYFNGQREMPAYMLVELSKDLKSDPATMLKALGYDIG